MVMSHWALWEVPEKLKSCGVQEGISKSTVNQGVALQHCALAGINVIDPSVVVMWVVTVADQVQKSSLV